MTEIRLINFINKNKQIFIPFAEDNYSKSGHGGILVNFFGDSCEYEYLRYPDRASTTGWIETDDKINKLIESYEPDKTAIYFFSDQ